MSLDNYFGNENTKLTKFKNIFYFDNFNYKCYWLDEIPTNSIIIKKINWKEYKLDIILCVKSKNVETFNKTSTKKQKIPLLKSQLQKNIRRNNIIKSLKSANELLCIDFNIFVRRLSIIMLEDCVLHNSFNILMWFIACNDKWLPSSKDINYCLNICKYLAKIEYKDYYKNQSFDFKKNIKTINILEKDQYTILYSLNLRISFGGMKGDMLMVNNYCNKFLYRFTNNIDINEQQYLNELRYEFIDEIYDLDYNNLKFLKVEEFDNYAVDFHNYPKLLSILSKEFEYKEDIIKQAIWFCRSSKTCKKLFNGNTETNIDVKLKYIYKKIKGTLNLLCRAYINKNY